MDDRGPSLLDQYPAAIVARMLFSLAPVCDAGSRGRGGRRARGDRDVGLLGDRYQGDAKSVWTAAKLPEAIPWLRERM
jgi:hypothetical protein